MSMDDFFPVAQSIDACLASFLPYLIKGAKLAGGEWFKKLGKEAVKQATEMWDSLKKSSKDNKRVEGTALLLTESLNSKQIKQEIELLPAFGSLRRLK